MSYCINPACPQPKNLPQAKVCQACGSKLLVSNRYRVGKILGKGGFGATFLAIDMQLPGRPPCVIKQLRPSSAEPEIFQMAKALFEREAETLGRIGNHPQIPRLLDYFEESQQFYLVQEYVQGLNLHQEIKQNGPYSEAGTKQFLSELLPIMQYIHSQQVIHRDIKPANLIRRDPDRKLVLIDFGAVKNQVSATGTTNAQTSSQTTLTAFAVGTAGFAPPEQLAMRPVYASDLYAVGVTCLYLLTAKSPKDLGCDPTTGEILWRPHVSVSDHFAKVLQTMLEVSVRHRYKSCAEVLEALDLEPYMDSLAQGLLSQPSTPTDSGNSNTGFLITQGLDAAPQTQLGSSKTRLLGKTNAPITEDDGALSATSKLAMAIRARRERKRQQMDSSPPPPTTPSRTPPPKSANLAPAPPDSTDISGALGQKERKSKERLEGRAVVEHFEKGRRDFAQLNLNFLNCQGANLAGAIFHQSTLIQANFVAATLTGADFGRTKLNQAAFRKANLCRAYFGYADLSGVDFRGADLQFAHLKHANLKGANLCGANLTNALVTEAQLELAKTNWATIFPSGKRSLWS